MNKLSLLSLNIVVVQPNHSINKINDLELRYFQTHRQFLLIVFSICISNVIKKYKPIINIFWFSPSLASAS